MNFKSVLVLALGLGVSVSVYGQETAPETKLKVEDALKNRQFREDGRITDIELKAQAGSLSRYSLKFDLSYSGPPVDNLSDPQMPNPDNRPRPNRTSLGGFMGLRYRMTSNDTFNVSTGARWFTPYHQVAGERVQKRPTDKDYEIANPQVSYDRTYVFAAMQMRSSVKGSVTTSDYYRDLGQTGSIGLSQGMKYTIGQSRFIVGNVFDADYYFFDRDFRASDRNVSNYSFTVIPSLEYKILDNLNLRSSVAWSFSQMRRADNDWDWESLQPSGRAGLGWAITRDIYFSPYLSFFTMRPAIRTTSASFSTVFSIF
jgi:hypothetical protein